MNLEELKIGLAEALGMTPQELDDTFRVSVKENSAVLSWRWLERATFIAFARWLDEAGGERRGTTAEIPLGEAKPRVDPLEKYRQALEILMQQGFFKQGGLIAVEEWLRKNPEASLEAAFSATRGLNPEEVPVVEAALKGETVDIDAMFPGGREGNQPQQAPGALAVETSPSSGELGQRSVLESTQETAGFEPAAQERFQIVPIDSIVLMPFQSRLKTDDLEDLTASVKEHGVLEPLIVRETTSGLYELVAGNRRLNAAKAAGLREVPVIIKGFTDREAWEVRLVENIQRRDLSDYEKARWLKEMISRFGYTQQQLAEKLGKTQGWISQHLRILELERDKNITRVIKPEQLTEHQAREILAAPPEKRAEIAERIAEISEVPSVRELRKFRVGFAVCDRCGIETSEPQSYRGKNLCPSCYEKALAEEEAKREARKSEEIDTGVVFQCPVCNRTYTIIHVGEGRHRFEPITVVGDREDA